MKEFETNEQFIHSLIIDDLDESISPENKSLLEQWRAADAANEQTYRDFSAIQQNIEQIYRNQPYTPEASWAALDSKLDQPAQLKEARSFKMWYSIAASLLLMLGAGYYFVNSNRYIVLSNDVNAAIKSIVLPDGTQIKLNGGTTIKYAADNFSTDRKVQLVAGEIFIKVVHNKKYPFTVDLGDIRAKDIGTSFNIIKSTDDVILTVEEGSVELNKPTASKSILLTAGLTGHYSAATGKLISLKNPDVNYKAWMDKHFVFVETPLSEVIGQLGKVYNTTIKVTGNQLLSRKLTANLHYQNPDSALNVIAATLQCRVLSFKGRYILSEN